MIDDLDRTLEELLRRELPQDLVGQVTISFATPDDQFPPTSVTLPAINLFLYDVRENATLRAHQWERLTNGTPNQAARKRTPFRLDCNYLLTTWASEPDDEHRLLSRAMMVLFRYPVLPEERLVGLLQGQPFDIQARLAREDKLTNPAEIWSALDNEVRPTVPYIVTLALDPWAETTEPIVRTLTLRTGQSIPSYGPAGESAFGVIVTLISIDDIKKETRNDDYRFFFIFQFTVFILVVYPS